LRQGLDWARKLTNGSIAKLSNQFRVEKRRDGITFSLLDPFIYFYYQKEILAKKKNLKKIWGGTLSQREIVEVVSFKSRRKKSLQT
jgi:hypothetical protein